MDLNRCHEPFKIIVCYEPFKIIECYEEIERVKNFKYIGSFCRRQ